MGFYKARELFITGLAEAHPLVRHNQPVSDEENAPLRQSFFRINEEDELLAACQNWIHFPCVVEFDVSGGDISKNGSLRQRNLNTWLFLAKVELDPNNPVFAPALTDTYDLTFDVMQDFKKSIAEEYEDNGSCGVFTYLDDAFAKWERYGPIGDQLYGWIFHFTDETKYL